jgi:hypothetical protein
MMGFFSKKEDTRYVKEFDAALLNVNSLARQFRELHFQSIKHFGRSFEKEKTPADLENERLLFERHLDVLQKLKFNADVMVDEAFKLLRNETALTEKDRVELRKLLHPPAAKTELRIRRKNKH